ncbi:MAG: UvrD-helicase domain-containing protein [Planctomycetota bacterium]|nr:UvrD-helicase domain-containing protein [Planctomycetota bacterium]
MSRPPLSPAQERAVTCTFDDALVTAGAGSGKTRVLSERFVHLVSGGAVELRRLAALTFTDKAAAQMRRRIAALLRSLAQSASAEDAERLEGWRADVEFAPISTIHAFCASILRQHAVEAGVDPAFQVLDALAADLILDEAVHLAEQRIHDEQPDLGAALSLLPGDGRAHLRSLLARVRGAGVDVADLEWFAPPGTDLTEAAALAVVDEAVAAFVPFGLSLSDDKRPAFDGTMAQLQAILPDVRAGRAEAAFALADIAGSVKALSASRAKAYVTARKELEAALGAVADLQLDRVGRTTVLPALKVLLTAYDNAYSQQKHACSALDFTDLELRARDLLRAAHARGEALDLAPHALLVDEFQDTNPLQAELLQYLRETAARVPQFAVGDPKQGIYRFRRADVRVIQRERERMDAARTFPMHESYRACPPLVASVNALNGALFAGGAAGVEYEPLVAAGAFLPSTATALDLVIVDGGDEAKIDDVREREAAWIAAEIHALVHAPTPRLKPVRDAAGQPTQESCGSLRYGDIAILFRASTSLSIYEAALEARGVPFHTQKSRGYFQADEIVDLVNVLRVVHNPRDRFALACAVTGPALGATDDELLRWFAPDPDDPRDPWERLVDEALGGGRHAAAVATIQALRREAVGGALANTVERALVELGLYEVALLQPGGDRAAANLRKAVELARQLDAGGRRGLDDLLVHLTTMQDRAQAETEAPVGGEADDVVRLTTVHSAKGLEYPVVFVADCGRAAPNQAPAILHDGGRAVAPLLVHPLEGTSHKAGAYRALEAREKAAEAEEALRVLYVAMTRAEERLYLTASAKGATKSGEPAGCQGWARLLWNALGLRFEHGAHDLVPERGARVRFTLVAGETVELPETRVAAEVTPVVTQTARARAEALIARAAESAAPLGHTRFVVSVSELLTFAESPQRYYHERVVLAGAREELSARWDAGREADVPMAASGDVDSALRRAERLDLWDEPEERVGPLDRAAVGRAVHGVIEHLRAEDLAVPPHLLDRAVEAEGGDSAFAAAVREMAERFVRAPLGQALRAALTAGADVRREVALHARIRFPGGETVGGFDSLLLKGSIDLWLPTPSGVLIIDHKTNRRGGRYDSPEALAAHYTWQLRLYALATERTLGQDVAGTRLILLDPSFGPDAVEVPIDVSGPALEEARALCRAFARAELEGRYPADWRSLLA